MQEKQKLNLKVFLGLIVLAFIFSILCRYIWIYEFHNVKEFTFHHSLMLTTNDSYYWAQGARDIIEHAKNAYLSPITLALPKLSAFIYKITPFSLEHIMLWMSVVLSSLIVVPIMLLARTLKIEKAGFIAALLASIAWSYYNRTMAGYFDTDMLVIVLPIIFLWSLSGAVLEKKDFYILITALDVLLYRTWYPASYSLDLAFSGLLAIFVIYKYIKKDNIVYLLALLSFILLAVMGFGILARLIIILVFYTLYKEYKAKLTLKITFIIFILVVIVFLLSGGLNPVYNKLETYVFGRNVLQTDVGLKLHFFAVIQTIKEASHMSFKIFASRISGSIPTFVLALIGYVLLLYRFRILLFSLPLLGLGILSLTGGLRFTIYAVPVCALGLGFLIVWISSYIKTKKSSQDALMSKLRYIFLTLATLAILAPNIMHIYAYKSATVFTHDEVRVLDKLKKVSNKDDYAVSWWDYGYPLRYFAGVKTIADGGIHGGDVNYLLSYILTNPQDIGAKLARLDVKYTDARYRKNLQANLDGTSDARRKLKPLIEKMTIKYGFKDTNKFISYLKTNTDTIKNKRRIFLYLPNRMLNILPTIELFSNLDLMTGKKNTSSFFYQSENYKEDNDTINLGSGIKILKKQGILQVRKQQVFIKNFAITSYDKKMNLHTNIQQIHKDGVLSVIYMKNYHKFLVLNDKLYNSLYIQLFVLEQYDKDLFVPVVLNPLAKVYRLKD